MSFFNLRIMLPERLPKLRIPGSLWKFLIQELLVRGGGIRESGAFLLGTTTSVERTARSIVLYDDLDPNCLSEGYVHFDGCHYGRLWEICNRDSVTVVADVHTHPFGSRQSHSDKTHPMVSIPGHFALIVPNFAQGQISATDIGVYVYRGSFRWAAYRGCRATEVFSIDTEETEI
ncbi:MAG: hypothetical protein ACYCRD_02730 [Leptospirillum sp.]